MVNRARHNKRQPLIFCRYWRAVYLKELTTDAGSGGQNGLRPS